MKKKYDSTVVCLMYVIGIIMQCNFWGIEIGPIVSPLQDTSPMKWLSTNCAERNKYTTHPLDGR